MPEQTTRGAEAEPALRSLADKVNWLIDRARPADPCSNAEVAGLIEQTTGERVSHTAIWKLRNGQAANPQMKLIEAMARTFGVPPGFFFEDFSDGQAGLRRSAQGEASASGRRRPDAGSGTVITERD
jgi:transcriptional regulator with XRE-family HTH domain